MALRLIFLLLFVLLSAKSYQLKAFQVPVYSSNNNLHLFPGAIPVKTSSIPRLQFFVFNPFFYMPKEIKPKRVHITYKDVMILFDKSDTSSWRMIQTARDGMNKAPKQIVSIKEFCDYYSLSYDETLKHLDLL